MRKKVLSWVLTVSMLLSICAAIPIPAAAQELPSAANVEIIGTACVGQMLTGQYVFNGSSERGSYFRWLRVSAVPSLLGEPNLIFTNNNVFAVTADPAGPPSPAVFKATDNTLITKISNYHYASSDTPGTISLQDSGGTTYGPWTAPVSNGYWCVYPDIMIPAGTYTIIDSKPGSWSFNGQSGNAGMTEVAGYTEISNATGLNYKLQSNDMGKCVLFEVTPKDADGNIGTAVRSSQFGPIPAAAAQVGELSYATLDEAIAAAAAAGDTIKLLDDIDYSGGLVPTFDLSFDLNGHTLDITNDSGNGMTLDGYSVNICGGGELNVTGAACGVWIGHGSSAEITNATATDDSGKAVVITDATGSATVFGNATANGSDSIGVVCSGEALIHGDVSAMGTNGIGAYAKLDEGSSSGGLITINGAINAPNYCLIGETAMTESDGELQGHYILYTNGDCTVRTKGIEFFSDRCEGALTDHWAVTGPGWTFTSDLVCPIAASYSRSQAVKFESFLYRPGYQARMYLNRPLNLSTGTNYWLEFWMYHNTESNDDDQIIVQISADGGESWTDLGTYHRFDGSTGWKKEMIDLSAYAGSQDLLIGFLGISAFGNNMFLDDISVSHQCIIDGCMESEAYGGFVSSREIKEQTYYEVASAEQLAHISEHMDLNYIQTADIDLSESYSTGWTPIGGFGDPDYYCIPDCFTGKYLGNEFEVQNLYIDYNDLDQNSCRAGLFAYVLGTDALISDLTVTVAGADLTCYNDSNYGTIASMLAGGTIRGCHVILKGDVITNQPNGNAGGIVSVASASYDIESGKYIGSIEDCTVTLLSGSILAQGLSKGAGGIAGYCSISISDCDVEIGAGECIRSSTYTGGIAGTFGKGCSITGCTVTGAGSIRAYPQPLYSQYIGGIAGSMYEATITDCVNEVTIDMDDITEIAQGEVVFAGGIVGLTGSLCTITGCENKADVRAEITADCVVDDDGEPVAPIGYEHVYAGGITGYVSGYSRAVMIENCENSADISAINRIPTLRAYAGGIAGHIDSANGDYASVTVLNCANLGTDKTVYAEAATTMAGGLAGSTTYTDFTVPNILIQNCYNEAKIYTESSGPAATNTFCVGVTAGGLIGAVGEVTVNDCYSRATDVSAVNDEYGDAYEGGLFGLVYNTSASQNYCEKNGNIIRAAGAIVKGMSIVAEDDQAGAYMCATAAQLKTKSFYGSGWNWYTDGGSAPDYYSPSNPWRMTAANAYPVLKGKPYTESTTPIGGETTVINYLITAHAGIGGTIDPSGNVYVQKYQSKTFTIKPEPGYIITDVFVDGVHAGAVSEYTFSSVTADHTIEASFEHPSQRFTDVDGSLWYREGIDFVLIAGLFNGTSDTTFEPNTHMTRAMLVTVLWRMNGEPHSTVSQSFSDVAAGTWYTAAVSWATENGIVKGYNTDTFGPNDPITCEQMAAVLYRYAGYKGYDVTPSADLSGFEDGKDTADWALTAMKWAVAEGLITGKSETKLDPAGNASRAQAATILMRFVKNIGE